MKRKWYPSATQRREFARRMKEDPVFQEEYLARKRKREMKERESSRYDYTTAGGYYVPTRVQYEAALRMTVWPEITPEESMAASSVIYGYTAREAIPHDHIHVVNELIRTGRV